MQLTSLEVKGFKSFADKVTIHFDKGITGIVGPNGCGKSNIVDAIRWVLGEQKTRMLRSDKMENIIFNGSKNRKQAQLAEVNLSFSNTKNILPTEFSQITITRRYYRSGESEYLLNGIACRLKDINNLFLDTGIGSDSYAIIELKMVEDLLTDREGSRRTIFEEAAGISKFKQRKKETFRKLEDTDADLERVEDLLFEITKNLSILEKQAKQAAQYFTFKDEYKQASINYSLYNARHFLDAQNAYQLRLNTVTNTYTEATSTLATSLAQTESDKAQILAAERLLQSRQKTLNEHVNAIRNYEGEKKLKSERMRYLTDKLRSVTNYIASDASLVDTIKQKIEVATSEIDTLSQQKEALNAKLADALKSKTDLEKTSAITQSKLLANNAALNESRRLVYNIKKEADTVTVQLQAIDQQLNSSSADTILQSENLNGFTSKLLEITQDLDQAKEQLQKITNANLQLQASIGAQSNVLIADKEALTKLTRQIDAKQNEYNLTKSLVENLEGFPEALKFLKKNKDWPYNAPLLSDIIAVPDAYRVAIETFLDPYLNYYVVDTQQQAIEGIKLLGQSGKGRANFFILDQIAQQPKQNADGGKGIFALTIAEADLKYQGLLHILLGNVYIIDGNVDTKTAAQDMGNLNQLIYLSLTDNTCQRRFSISGGSTGIFEGKRIGRAKNLDKLLLDISKLNIMQAELKDKIEVLTAHIKTTQSQIDTTTIASLNITIAKLSQDYAGTLARHQQLEVMLANAGLQASQLEAKRQDLLRKAAETSPKVVAVESSLAALQSETDTLIATAGNVTKNLTLLNQVYNQQNTIVLQHDNLLATKKQDANYSKLELQGLEKRNTRNLEDQQTVEKEIRTLAEKAVLKDDELLALYSEKDAIERGVSEADQAYYAARGKLDGGEKQARDLQMQKDDAASQMQNLKMQVAESKMALTQITQRLAVEFEVEVDDALLAQASESNTHTSETELKQKSSTAKAKLDRLGPINPMAVEAYNEINERATFIKAQKQDLADAKTSLLQTIAEIDAVAKASFSDTFSQIRTHFQTVFRTLFTDEDTCDVFLTDPANPLDSPIDIIAKPKGKKPLTINQLSGGEKTLTAISLLFAIYLVKPAPFCVFDEVDAPLDDANIDKFNNIIRKFSNDSQFIVVTHNKRTMASTDVIYGVTMPDVGVSRVLPVDLRAYQD